MNYVNYAIKGPNGYYTTDGYYTTYSEWTEWTESRSDARWYATDSYPRRLLRSSPTKFAGCRIVRITD